MPYHARHRRCRGHGAVALIPPHLGSPTLSTDARAQLGPADSTPPTEYVRFQFNPATITVSHTANTYGNAAAGSFSLEDMAKAMGTTSIALRSCVFDGGEVLPTCQRLLEWTYLEPAADSAETFVPKLLHFIWGTKQTRVTLHQATVTYNRFNRSGVPVRASVDLTLHEVRNTETPTNPSSGGMPGRRSHLLTGAESLPELATRSCGGPGRWREIAAANRFEDPLRVRPGTVVYLPGSREGER